MGHDDDATWILGQAPAPRGPGDALPGHIGHYRVVSLLGEGGMGQVYLAEQLEPIRRRVALKLMREQLRGGRHAEVYFEVERQALARMEHPAIARVYEAGQTPEGNPWLAMEYVDGEPLDAWRRAARPDLRTRLAVLVGLLRGVAHAHQRGIVHRDLKPSNVLVVDVDGQPQAKLIDFGIAIGVGGFGAAGTSTERTGSAGYMSPEQYAGRSDAIDVHTDLYSLGVMLLELLLPEGGLALLGDPPPRREALHRRVKQSLKGADSGPLDRLPRELRFVVERALRPEPGERYPDAATMASDVQAWLDGRPLQVVPASRTYVARKFVGRNRLAVGLASLSVLALLVGLAASLWAMQQARDEALRSRATADFLTSLLSGVDPDRARDQDKTLLLEIVEDAGNRAADELSGQPVALAEIESVVSESLRSLDEFPRALELAVAAHERAIVALGERHLDTLDYARRRARLESEADRFDLAEDRLRDTLAAYTARQRDTHAGAMLARQELGWLLRVRGHPADANSELAAVGQAMTAELGESHAHTIETRFMEAITLADLDRFDEAIELLGNLIALREQQLGDDHPRVLAMRNSLAVFFLQAQLFPRAETELRAMLPIHRRVFGDRALNTITVMSNLAGALRQQGKVAEAGPFYEQVAQTLSERYGPTHVRALQARYNHGNFLRDNGETGRALSEHREVLAAAHEVIGESHVTLGEMLTGYGATARDAGEYEEAERALLRALEIRESQLGHGHSRTAMTREGLRELYTRWGREDMAARYIEDGATAGPPGAIRTR